MSEADVQILDKPPAIRIRTDSEELEYQGRRRRRRKIRRMARRAKGLPSFYKLLTANYEVSDDEGDEDEPLMVPSAPVSMMYEDPLPTPATSATSVHPQRLRINVNAKLGLQDGVAIQAEGAVKVIPSNIRSLSAPLEHIDEGYYTGVIPMEMAEDSVYMPPLQIWIRQQFEYFSATEEDSRRLIRQGRVGIRCIHCAGARTSAGGPWPVGALSYPTNLSALYTMCSQKPYLHFEAHCKNMPDAVRQELHHIQHSERSNKRAKGGISAQNYYVIAAKRLGFVDTDHGIRFGRDLNLDPLPLETIRQQFQQQQQQQQRRQQQQQHDQQYGSTIGNSDEVDNDLVTPNPVLSGVAPVAVASSTRRVTADDDSEKVLAEAVAESDEGHICKSDRKHLVSDYMFLTMRQMIPCNALPTDISSRGKKSKMFRIGMAGYTCRHCAHTQDGCRSFPSAADNLLSAISNSFAVHLQKCMYIPAPIQKALTVYKRLHSRQMAQLPHGSQRRLMYEIWDAVRSNDKTKEEMASIVANLPVIQEVVSTPVASIAPVSQSVRSAWRKKAQDGSFPTCDDPELQAIVDDAEKNWNTAANDNLILPEERGLVSDYVFLTMRQLRAVAPMPSTRVQLYGLSCIHCHDQETQVSSGRSFPSAPDNYASALNTGFYNHMQSCIYVPTKLKQALMATRKIHSAQCASLKFGSQRKYFNILFRRLQSLDEEKLAVSQTEDKIQSKLGFLNISTGDQAFWVCQKCSWVPMCFRAPHSVCYQGSNSPGMKQHERECKGKDWDFGLLGLLLKDALQGQCNLRLVDAAALSQLIGHQAKAVDSLSKSLASALAGESTVVSPPVDLSSWQDVPSEFVDAEARFMEFSTTIKWTGSQNLRDVPKLLSVLQLLFPALNARSASDADSVPSNRGAMDVDDVTIPDVTKQD